MSDVGRTAVRLAAATAIAFGFLILGFEVYRHVVSEGGSTLAAAWFVAGGVLILWGAGVLDFKGASPALHDLAAQVPIVAPMLRGLLSVVLPGGNRATDPPAVPSNAAIAEAQAELPQSGTLAAPHAFDPGA